MNNRKELYLGDNLVNSSDLEISGNEVVINNENFYKISNVNKMRPFFMSIVSAYDHWLFISSTGALSAGRKNSNNALFPYYTDDKIAESFEVTGHKSIFHIYKNDKTDEIRSYLVFFISSKYARTARIYFSKKERHQRSSLSLCQQLIYCSFYDYLCKYHNNTRQ